MSRHAYIDFDFVEPHHRHVHARLVNWSLWVKVHRCGAYPASPIFKLARSNSRQWHQPEYRPTADLQDAYFIEHEVAKLPRPHAEALRWVYVHGGGPGRIARLLGVSKQGLHRLVRDGRQMLDGVLGEGELRREVA